MPAGKTQKTAFISYASRDKKYFEQLVDGLKGHSHGSAVMDWNFWDDREILMGAGWHESIQNAIEQADFAILLVSRNFVNSGYIAEHEVAEFIRAQKERGFLVFPILVLPYNISRIDTLASLQFFKPLYRDYFGEDRHRDKSTQLMPFSKVAKDDDLAEEYYMNLVEAIEKAVGNLPKKQKEAPKPKVERPKPVEEKETKPPVIKTGIDWAAFDQQVDLGDKAYSDDDFKKAQTHYEKALQINPRDRYAKQKLAACKKLLAKPKHPATLTEAGIEFILVEGGTFNMGYDPQRDGEDTDSMDTSKPLHKISLDSFYIGKHPVTQAQWQQVIGKNPSEFKGCDDCPVENVSWKDAQDFLKKISHQTGQKFRLPTEAEWEFAARGGNKSKDYRYAGSNNSDEVAWYRENSNGKTHPLGQKAPNELGIYDMSGNVWEWCQDWFDKDYYSSSPQNNPKGPNSGGTYANYVLRGGSWFVDDYICRVAIRYLSNPTLGLDDYGFRIFSGL